MKSQLLLYINTSIIVPVSCDAGGRSHGTEPIYYSGKINSEQIEQIKDFYQSTTGVSTIDTHYVFAENLDATFRKELITDFSNEGMQPKSFTLNPSIILAEYALKQASSAESSFGEHVMIVYSNDEALRLTATVYDGTQWQWNANNKVIDKVGSSPLKRCIIECLIAAKDKSSGSLDERKREKEIEYQMQFADEWLSEYKKLSSSDNFIVDFKFSFETSSVRLRIPKKEIELSYDKILSPAVSTIIDYKKERCNASVKYAVFFGPAFEEENFTLKVKNAIECNEQFSVITINKFGKVLRDFLVGCEFEEDFGKYDRITQEKERIYKSNLEWIQYAQELIEFGGKLEAELKELNIRVADDTASLEAIIGSCNAQMQKSAFDEAREVLGGKIFPSVLAGNSIKEARLLLAQKENLEGVFEKLERVDGARILITKIQNNAENLSDLINKSNSHADAIKNKSARIDFCESKYDEYLDLKRKFKRTTVYKEQKALVEQMQEISDEPMPALKLRQVFAEIIARKEKVKAGWFKKKDILHVTVKVKDDDTLPCEALLNISNKVRIKSSEGDDDCLAFEIEKGSSLYTVTIENEDNILDFSKDIICQLFVGKDVLDKHAIDCEYLTVKK